MIACTRLHPGWCQGGVPAPPWNNFAPPWKLTNIILLYATYRYSVVKNYTCLILVEGDLLALIYIISSSDSASLLRTLLVLAGDVDRLLELKKISMAMSKVSTNWNAQ